MGRKVPELHAANFKLFGWFVCVSFKSSLSLNFSDWAQFRALLGSRGQPVFFCALDVYPEIAGRCALGPACILSTRK